MQTTFKRLYPQFQPAHYSLEFAIDEDTNSIEAHASITGTRDVDSATILLHAKDLSIDSIKVNGSEVKYTHEKYDCLVIEAPDASAHAQIEIDYRLNVSTSMHGIYRSSYQHDGSQKQLISTQFESHHAREGFPCIDEPEAKATFDVTISSGSPVVLSNTPLKSQSEDTRTFQTTPRMSPYLLAFVCGDLHETKTTSTRGTAVSIWSTPAHSTSTHTFAAEIAAKSLDFFEDYFDTPYPLPKIDHVAIPDFSSGAMENWGLVTYREQALLVDEATPQSSKEHIATVITHETSHQWFGNLVTMKWWDDLWLNESFASFMEYVAVDAIKPEWNIWALNASYEIISALRRDYLPGVQTIKQSVNEPDEISTLFDPSIVYAKGSRMLDMLHSLLGEDDFRRGLKTYFDAHAYGNTTGADLWEAFSAVAGLDVGALITPWLEQPNMPLVHVETEGDQIRLSQSTFVQGESSSSKLWPIPLGGIDPATPAILEETSALYTPSASLQLLNHNTHTHMVVSYGTDLFTKLTAAIIEGKLGMRDRMSLLHDATLIARTNKGSLANAVELIPAYAHETEEPVWDIVSVAIADIKRFVNEDETNERLLKKLILNTTKHALEKLGTTMIADESDNDQKLRSLIIGLRMYAEDRVVIDSMLSHQSYTLDDVKKLDPELRDSVLYAKVRYDPSFDLVHMINLHQQATNDVKLDIASALTGSKDPKVHQTLLANLKDSSIVKPQDFDRWIAQMIRNKYSREATWQWVVANWSWIHRTFDGDKSYDMIPRYVAGALSTEAWLEKYKEFFGPMRDQASLTRSIDLGMEEITGRINWIKKDKTSVVAALRHFDK